MSLFRANLVALILFSSLMSISSSPAQNKVWFINTRIQQGIEYDSNIEEARDSIVSDGLMKLVLNSRAKYVKQKWLLQLTYHGGLQHYFASPLENKLSHDCHIGVNYLQSRKIVVGGSYRARLKTYFRRNWDHLWTDYETFMTFLLAQYQLSIFYAGEEFNYLNYDQFDFGVSKLRVLLQRNIGDNFSLQLKACQQRIDFTRRMLIYDAISDNIFIADEKQKDNNRFIAVQWTYQKKWLASLEYLFQHNSSNSYGFSYQFFRTTFSAAVPLSQSAMLRMFAGAQRKKYAQPLNKLITTDLDSEREMGNFLIFDLSKELTPSVSILFRYSYFYNESPIPGRYFEKQLSSCSLEYRF